MSTREPHPVREMDEDVFVAFLNFCTAVIEDQNRKDAAAAAAAAYNQATEDEGPGILMTDAEVKELLEAQGRER